MASADTAGPGAPVVISSPLQVDGPADPVPARRLWPWRARRLGLRARVTTAFAIGALLLSVGMSLLVIGVAQATVVSERESLATQRMFFNADIVRSGIDSSDIAQVLSSLPTPEGSRPVLFQRSQQRPGQPASGWTQLTTEYGYSAIPEALRDQVLGGTAAKMRFTHPDGDKSLALGIPVADFDGAYFEIVSLESVDNTLQSISFTLFGASIATVLAGAGLGWYASRRILRPLGEVGDAARKLAGGELDTRIRALVDPDLEPIITSFNGMADTLEDRIGKDARFASDVSHELRSPLMTLQASIEVLDNHRDVLNDRAQSALDLLAADLDRFRELVEDLLEISRFDAGVMRLELEEVLLTDFVRHVVRSAGCEHVPVERDPNAVLDEELGAIITAIDKRRVARVLTNLLNNAEKYGDGAVQVLVTGDATHVRIFVDDAGEGVPPENRDRIFERFNRAGAAHRRGSSTGVGLGLALVAEHVGLHGGRVWVEDAPSGGARFAVELPRVELEEHETPADLA